MYYMEFYLNEQVNVFKCGICSYISMNIRTYLNVLYGVLSQ